MFHGYLLIFKGAAALGAPRIGPLTLNARVPTLPTIQCFFALI
jgi:hypothetical protein